MENNDLMFSWADQVESHLISLNNSDLNTSCASDSTNSQRNISLEFIEDANVEKFDRLVKEEKLKIPFKRRYSQTLIYDSRSNSPNSLLNDDIDNTGINVGNNDLNNGKPCENVKNTRIESKKSYVNGITLQKRIRQNSCTSISSSSSSLSNVEVDPAILARRQKQIDYGKNTIAYERYIQQVPRSQRSRENPRTPNKYGKYSRRAFDGLIKIWRKQLHNYDPPIENKEEKTTSDSDSDY